MAYQIKTSDKVRSVLARGKVLCTVAAAARHLSDALSSVWSKLKEKAIILNQSQSQRCLFQ